LCDGLTNDACNVGTSALCTCAETCTNEDAFNTYVNCHQDNDGANAVVTCYGSFVDSSNTVDCGAAADSC